MLSLRAFPSFSLTFSPSKHLPSQFKSKSSIKMSSSSNQCLVEHIVLFKVKRETESSKVNVMVNELSSLAKLDHVAHLTVGPILHSGPKSDLRFTHMIHSRFNSKEDLNAYNLNPTHVSVVKGYAFPISDDAMAVDWVAGDSSLPHPPPGSAIRLTLLKLKENVSDEVKDKVLGVVGGMKDGVSEISWGENFSPARAKGFSIASLAVFPGRSELERVDPNEGLDTVTEHVESVMVVDYMVPSF